MRYYEYFLLFLIYLFTLTGDVSLINILTKIPSPTPLPQLSNAPSLLLLFFVCNLLHSFSAFLLRDISVHCNLRVQTTFNRNLDWFTLFNKIISKQSKFFEMIFMDFLVDCPPCIIIYFINNIHFYLQCHKRCGYIMVAFIISCNKNLIFRMVNGILNFFLENHQDGPLILHHDSQYLHAIIQLCYQHQQFFSLAINL